MTHHFESHSIIPSHIGFLSVAQETRCGNCGRELTAPTAVYFALPDGLVPLGPNCAKRCAVDGSLNDLPNVTKWVFADSADPADAKGGRAGTKGVDLTPEQIDRIRRAKVVEYALLRAVNLPEMTVGRGAKAHPLFSHHIARLRYRPLVECAALCRKGQSPSEGLVRAVESTMRTTSRDPSYLLYSYANIRACAVWGWVLTEIGKKWIPKAFNRTWLNLTGALGWTMRLTPAQCDEARGLAKELLPKVPAISRRVQFVTLAKPSAQAG